MYIRGGEKGMDALAGRRLDRGPAPVDIAPVGASQAADHRPVRRADVTSDSVHRLPVALRGRRETGLDDIHAQAGQLPGYPKLLLASHREARRLLAIPQRGIEDSYLFGHRFVSLFCAYCVLVSLRNTQYVLYAPPCPGTTSFGFTNGIIRRSLLPTSS